MLRVHVFTPVFICARALRAKVAGGTPSQVLEAARVSTPELEALALPIEKEAEFVRVALAALFTEHGIPATRFILTSTFDASNSMPLATWQVDFSTTSNAMLAIAKDLELLGVGVAYGEVFAADVTFRKSGTLNRLAAVSHSKESATLLKAIEAQRVANEFLKRTKDNARLNSDFIAYLTIASVLCSVGLSSGLGVVLVAAVLVSPLMGPIIQSVAAILIRDWRMLSDGLAKELFGLIYAFTMGAVMASLFSYWAMGEPMKWPNRDMTLRASETGMLLACLTGGPAGAAVAWTSLSGTPVVGAAISAALLPPIVNAGMNFFFAAVGHKYSHDPVPAAQVALHWKMCAKALATTLVTLTMSFIGALCVFTGRRLAATRFNGKSFEMLALVDSVKKATELSKTNAGAPLDLAAENDDVVDPNVPDSASVRVNGVVTQVGDIRRTVSIRAERTLERTLSRTESYQHTPVSNPGEARLQSLSDMYSYTDGDKS